MKNVFLILTGLLAVIASSAHAQFRDEFSNSQLSPSWRFTVSGNNPADTSDPTHYSVKNGALSITLQPGNLQYAYVRNLPSVMLADGPTNDYSIETKVSASFDSVAGYPAAGIVLFTDTRNYVFFGIQHNSFKDANYNFATVSCILNGKTDANKNAIGLSTDYTNLGTGSVPQSATLTIKKTGSAITFGYIAADGKTGTVGTLSASDTDDKKAAYEFLCHMSGKQVGLYTDTAYTKTAEIVSFDFLHLTGLKVVTTSP